MFLSANLFHLFQTDPAPAAFAAWASVLLAGNFATMVTKWIIARMTDSGIPRGDAARVIHYIWSAILVAGAFATGVVPVPAGTCTDALTCLGFIGLWFSSVALFGGIAYDLAKAAFPE